MFTKCWTTIAPICNSILIIFFLHISSWFYSMRILQCEDKGFIIFCIY